jgi:hypothetical protein
MKSTGYSRLEQAPFKTVKQSPTPRVKVTFSMPMTISVYYNNKKDVQEDDSEKRNKNLDVISGKWILPEYKNILDHVQL